MLLCALAAEAQTQRVAVDATAHAERVLANMPRFQEIQQQQPSKTVDTADRSLDALERRLPTVDALEAQLLTDPHSPGKFRIVGALQNNEDFARSFQCPEGSPMNPTEKCDVW